MKYFRLTLILLISVMAFVLSIGLLSIKQDSQAQGNAVEIVKTLNRDSNVVRVGELLTFTIALTNHSSFTLTNVTLIDQYRNDIMAYAGSSPGADTIDTGTGRIVWSNVATPSIPSGQNIQVTVSFTAEHPSPAVVNYARAEDVTHSGGQLNITATTEITREAIGGAAPIIKSMWPPDLNPIIGLPVTFTHHITNDGAAMMTRLPLSDTYDASFLEFNFAIPSPSIASPPGSLVWDDLTDYFGDLLPFETVIVTTVFTALLDVSNTVNRASTEGAMDEYGNDLAGGLGLVPIIIVPQPTNTPQVEPTPQPSGHSSPTNTAVPTVTATPAPTSTPSPTSPAFPSRLPETGNKPSSPIVYVLWLGGILLVFGNLIILLTRSGRRQ